MEWVLLAVTGLVAGVLGGMFGIGGGVVIVPMLMYVLHYSQTKAQGTSLAVLLPPIGILGVMNYWKAGQIDIRQALIIALGFILGGYFGSKASLTFDPVLLRKAFALLLIGIAVQMWFGKE
ncbi:sulfite exporter TauE/SafE family protein [Fimbriimonas ginsengisoli]|uniref:Probable membrane transporter protein n=1 Tax=Fimbriimonas ginsengisoli Gsoil 348 TaxID=661478 RepID=A0A068NP83_FIMGI|nr:sulfite exporter TauE/SafE family protein [Fimbriimonas ginsengisoli]AIE85182.1 hypothetical protein OP10G_1814 [Fimbriimonas ginsengisoli Gsoil 348]